MTDPTTPPHEPFVPPDVLNESSSVLNGEEAWRMSPPPTPVAAPTAVSVAPPPPSPPPRERKWIAWVAILGSVALIVILVVIGVNAIQSIASYRPADAAPAPGAPTPRASASASATPTATPTPVVTICPPECIDLSSAGLMIPNNSLEMSAQLDQLLVSAQFANPTAAAQEYRTDASAWAAQTALPGPCFFVGSRSPISPSLGGSDSGSADPVTFLGENVTDAHTSQITQSARFFTDSASATDYLRRLDAQAIACHIVHPSIDSSPNFPSDPILEAPSSIAVIAITEKDPSSTTYIYDLQRANVVVRFRAITDGSVSEATIRHFLSTWATTDFAQIPTRAG